MCGIAGAWRISESGPVGDALTLAGQKMAASLSHRGPDGQDVWTDQDAGLCLAHRRLAVQDLSPAGAQPMRSASGRYVITFNGEIYNHAELRAELAAEGCVFRGSSDTETLVEAVNAWGVESAVQRCVGMFALAAWDRSRRILTLVRDRLGIKPLYWGRVSGVVAFASELKAFRTLPGWRGDIDRDSLAAFMRTGCVPAPLSIYRGIGKVEPGMIIDIDGRGGACERRYWDVRALMAGAAGSEFSLGDAEATDHLDFLLKDSVKLRMLADVPIGAFLSGGVDSSLVAAQMQALSNRPIATFSVGFEEQEYNEARHAAAIADHLGTCHTEVTMSARQAADIIPSLPHVYDEPFADSSQIPTLLISRAARKSVTVILGGDGGDEVFAGYTRYVAAQTIMQPLQNMPAAFRRAISVMIGALTPEQWDVSARLMPRRKRPPQFGQRLYKLKDALSGDGPADFSRSLMSHRRNPEDVVIGGLPPPHLMDDQRLIAEIPDMVRRMQCIDMLSYLPDDILTKIDRAGMSVGLEVRAPLLDHRIVEFAATLPPHMRIRNKQTKWLLRQVLQRYVPKSIIDRPKMGFAVPLDSWLRGPLRDWAESLLEPQKLAQQGYLKPKPIRDMWENHCTGAANSQHLLWDVLMFQAWREAEREQPI